MITVTINMVDDLGQSIEITHHFNGDLVGKNLDEIESLVCEVKKETMRESELALIALNQRDDREKKKVAGLKCNGSNEIEIRTLNGLHKFHNQRYIDGNGVSSSYITNRESNGLSELYSYYGTRLSYRDLCDLLTRVVGEKLYGKRQLQNKIVSQAVSISAYLGNEVVGNQLCLNLVEDVAIYEECKEELYYFDDGVGVKRQKEERQKGEKAGSKSCSRVETDVVVIGNERLGYDYLSSAEANLQGISFEERIRLHLSKYTDWRLLPIVVIADGARTIRCRAEKLFGKAVVILLDWYHLKEKIRQYLSRLGLVKATKEAHIYEMLNYLWKGQVTEALIYSDVTIKTQKADILEELQKYLLKHKAEICNYELRQLRNKPIGSGRGEKANDQLVAHRQKKKAMAWSEAGSNSLTVIKSLEVNQLWQNYWQDAA